MLVRLISGGQTGVDRGGLEAATELNIQTGGWCPKGWKTEAGMDLALKAFGLRETSSSDYPPRTLANVRDSDGTVVFGHTDGRGLRLTIRYCTDLKKPYLLNPDAGELRDWIEAMGIHVLNVAGSRESKAKGIKEATRKYLVNELR